MAFIQGNSQCALEIADNIVRKTSASADYSARLQQQVQKQRAFGESNKLWFCRTPAVLAENWKGPLYQVEMQYVSGMDFIEFITHASRDELELVANHVGRLVEQNIAASPTATVPFAALEEKMKSIAARCDSPALRLFDRFPARDLTLPVGVCHGDLTLSNILFCHTSMVLLDFLDNFVETPLQDMAKIRQDTCYFWSCQLYRQSYDQVRVNLALRFMDRTLDELFSRHDFYRNHYPIFQFVNLARILPYCQTPALRQHVERSIETLVKTYV